ncbi:lithostathine-like [Labrus mixtus]|uniref:lithostathine-like n=1 Tax=Labrus mixtus TaxID=508554 RepID=UPI0029BFD67F|nr:lithostathine-like [Labrus mixtus]
MFGMRRVINNWYWTMAHILHLSLLLNCAGLKFFSEPKSWIDALEQCQNNNSSLVEIHNESVRMAVDNLLENKIPNMTDGVWIGLERPIFGCIIPWLWTTGQTRVCIPQWNVSHPVDRFNNHCGKIIWVEELMEFKWLDANCHLKLPFICQNQTKTTHKICTSDPTVR